MEKRFAVVFGGGYYGNERGRRQEVRKRVAMSVFRRSSFEC